MTSDIVIAGAGPNGLMLACELQLAGVRPIVLERLAEPSQEPKANGLVGQVVRLLDRRGLYEPLSDGPQPPQPSPRFMFGALPLDLARLTDNPLYMLPVPQYRIEQGLAKRAAELGVEVRRGHELTGLSQDEEAVELDVVGPDGPYRLRARYLVGADGGHSITRKLAAIGFPGVTTDAMVSRAAHASPPPDWVDPATGALTVPGYGVIPPFQHHRNEQGLFVFAAMSGRPPLVSTGEWHTPPGDEEPMTLEEMRASITRVLGVDMPLEPPAGPGPHLLRRNTGGNTRLAERYRDRRIFLTGDAAHVHSSIGGPGLNLGLQDTVNLGWKLAAAVNGWAPTGLLDTYEAERRPVADRVNMHTQAQSLLISPGRQVTALRELFTELLGHEVNLQHLADLISGADIRYDMGGRHRDPLIGRWAPDLELETDTGPVRLAELTRSARPLLLDLTADAAPAAALAGWRDRVDITAARVQGAPATALLVRPDGYTAWATASTRPAPAELEDLRDTARRWFGTPPNEA